jgi:hypothetical protein
VEVDGTATVNDTSTGIAYGGSGWTAAAMVTGLGLYNDDHHYTATSGDNTVFNFYGTQVIFYYLTDTNRGVADITIDGMSPANDASIDQYATGVSVLSKTYHFCGSFRCAVMFLITALKAR